MRQLGIEMIPAYSPEARGRSERAFRTHQDRLIKELALAGITEIKQANAYIREVYMPAYNDEFAVPEEPASMFVLWPEHLFKISSANNMSVLSAMTTVSNSML
jgi:hypothetical protein